METLSHKYNIMNKKVLFLFVFLDLLIISSIFLFRYIDILILFAVFTFLLLNFVSFRAGLLLMIGYSTMVIYGKGLVSAFMMVILGSILIFVCLSVYFKFCIREFKIKKAEINLPIAVFLGIVFLQTIRGFLNIYSLKWLSLELLAYLGFGAVFLVINLCDKKEIIKKFFQVLVIVAYYQAIMGLWNYFRIGHRIGGHLFGIFPSSIALVLLNLSFYSKERAKKLIYILISLPFILHLLLSFTRGYWLGFILALLFSYGIYIINSEYSFSEKVFRFLKGVLLLSIIIVTSLIPFQQFLSTGSLMNQVSRRFKSGFSTELSVETVSNYQRLMEYDACLEKIQKKPILGYGIGYTLPLRNPITQRVSKEWAVHQSYLMITLKMGLIGLAAFLWIFYVFIRTGLRESKNIENNYYKGLSYGFIANVIQLLVISFTNYSLATVDNTFYLAFAMAGVVIINSRRN